MDRASEDERDYVGDGYASVRIPTPEEVELAIELARLATFVGLAVALVRARREIRRLRGEAR